jgi:formiminotetrahydrofolate cyclodeaminase
VSDYVDLSLEEFLEQLGSAEPATGGGAAAAVAVASAAGVVAMVARCSRATWRDAAGVAAQAVALQERAALLAQRNSDAWRQALAALAAGEAGEPGELERRLDRSAELPLAIADTAADVAQLAALTASLGDGTFRADASTAAVLAAAGARAGAHLVAVNLATRPDDSRLARARAGEEAAERAAERALDAGP